jgi:hypothetical protein
MRRSKKAPIIVKAMGGGQHAVPVDQAPTAHKGGGGVAQFNLYVRHEGILAVGHLRTA